MAKRRLPRPLALAGDGVRSMDEAVGQPEPGSRTQNLETQITPLDQTAESTATPTVEPKTSNVRVSVQSL